MMSSLITRNSCACLLLLILVTCLLPVAKFADSSPSALSTEKARAASANFANLPLSFEVNAGQSNPKVRFLSRNPGYQLFLAEQEAVLAITPAKGQTAGKDTSVK